MGPSGHSSYAVTQSAFSTTASEELITGQKTYLGTVDIVIIVVYMVATISLGLWASRIGARGSVSEYFLAGKRMFWLPVGASVFVSNIGSVHFVGLAGSGAITGISVGAFEWVSAFYILCLGWFLLPIYVRSKVYTMPEYLHKRYGGSRLRVILSVLSLAMYVLTKIAVDLFAGALFIQQALNINMYVAIVSLLVITAAYTLLGGLKAVIYTDTMQTLILLIGGILLMVISFSKVGGYENLKKLYMEAIPQTTKDILAMGNFTTCGIPRDDAFHLFRDPINSDLPWPGMIFGISILAFYYFGTDQVIVQRVLAAKSVNHGKAGCVLAASLKILPVYMFVMAGMVSRALFPNEVACAVPSECLKICGNEQGCSNIAYPKLVLEVLPSGLRGIMVAAMLSALMSSLTSIFNSTSTVFTIDVWKRIRKGATEREMLIVGKVTVCVLVVISILWVPVLLSSAGGQVFIYLNSVLASLAPPIAMLYFLGVLCPQVNEKGAFWGFVVGIAIGITRLVLDFVYPAPGCDQLDTRPAIVAKVNYLYVAVIVFIVSNLVAIAVSYFTKKLSPEQLANVTWFTLTVDQKSDDEKKIHLDGDDEIEMQQIASCDGDEKYHGQDSIRKVNPDSGIQYLSNPVLTGSGKVRWGNVINAAAILLMVVMGFLIGYYA
nr:sodium/glucose cotransporter 5-like [Ciona intestinalis]|eukprot:XP_002131980.1 sodium/glucose cotransporter 5-like [Ciona intestinalis]